MRRAPAATLVVAAVAAGLVLCGCEDERPSGPAGPTPVAAIVELVKAGDGRGEVRSLPAGVVCDVDCDADRHEFADVDAVTLVVEPDRDAQLRRVECAPTQAGVAPVVVEVVDAAGEARATLATIIDGAGIDWSCTADFVQVQTLQVLMSGDGAGRVQGALSAALGADEPKRIDCPDDCIGAYFFGEAETLTAIPDEGSVFGGWRFCGAGTGALTLVMDQDHNCGAVFDLR